MLLKVNGKFYEVDADTDTPLLWVIREHLGLTGTKFGCGKGICGACTVLINGEPIRSCITPLEYAKDKEITTVEGIPENHPVKVAWIKFQVPQCGYCQPGQIVEAYALLKRNPEPSRKEIISAMKGHICRCGTYPRIIKAIEYASKLLKGEKL